MKLAGSHAEKLLGFLQTPLGEEVGEGIIGGGMAGLSQIGTDSPPEEIALKTLGAIAGGIGVGMLGRKIGAAIGRRSHPEALKDQHGMLANLSRTMGSESTIEGAKQQARATKIMIQEDLVNKTSAGMLEEALINPNKFAEKYGVTVDEFKQYMPGVKSGRQAAAAAEMWATLPENTKHELVHKALSPYKRTEQAITSNAANSIDEKIQQLSQTSPIKDKKLPGSQATLGELTASMLNPVPDITGEHVGRAIGRFFGDEIGVIGGMSVGGLAANQLGIQDSRDKKIKELQAQLSNTRY